MDESVAPVRARGIRPDLDVTWELESEFASSDSDATTSGLIGPGRTLGLAYDWAGERVESHFKKFSFARNVRTPKKNNNRSTDSLSSNATADNLPGPGRTLGLAYGWGGLHLEKRFNKFAEKLGYGPKAAEQKLEEFGRRYSVFVSDIESGEWDPTNKPPEFLSDKSARKIGKRLLKYSKSRVEATQMQALDAIMDLCYKEPLLRDFFFELSGLDVLQEVHARSDTDHLLSRSRKALVFLSDAQVNNLFRTFRYGPAAPTAELFAELRRHLLDPYSSFIVLRFLVDQIYMQTDSHIFQALLSLAEKDSDYVDWNSLDRALSFAVIYGKTHQNTHCLGQALIPILSHAGKLPRSTFAMKNAFAVDATSWDEFLDGPAENICRALGHFTLSDDFNIHIASTSMLEKVLREFISPWHDELQNLLDEPTIIYCHVFHKRRKLPKAVYRALRCDVPWKSPSVDDGVRFRALQVVQAIMGLDRYCSSYFLKAFADANRGNMVFSSSLVPHARQLRSREYGEGVIPDDIGFVRHNSIDGTFHIGRPDDESCVEGCNFKSCNHLWDESRPLSACKRCGMGREYKLSVNEHALLWLRHEHGASPVDTSVHYPILVGTNQSGLKQFIAFVGEGEGFWSTGVWTTVGECETTVKFRTNNGELGTTENYYVPVLRFDFSELNEIFPNIPEDGSDSTGPFYWKPYDAMYEIFEGEELPWSRNNLAVRESYGVPFPLQHRRANWN